MTWVSILNILKVRSVAGLVLQVSGSLVEVDILELSESPWPSVGIFHMSMGLGRLGGLEANTGNAERR